MKISENTIAKAIDWILEHPESVIANQAGWANFQLDDFRFEIALGFHQNNPHFLRVFVDETQIGDQYIVPLDKAKAVSDLIKGLPPQRFIANMIAKLDALLAEEKPKKKKGQDENT